MWGRPICSPCTATASPRPRIRPARPFDETGLETILQVEQANDLQDIGASIFRAVEAHRADNRFADDLTVLLLRRTTPASA